MNIPRGLVGVIAVILIAPLAGGCVNYVWQTAGGKNLELYRIYQPCTSPDGIHHELVIGYSVLADGSGEHLYRVPLDESGLPVDKHLVFHGTSRSLKAISHDLGAAGRGAVASIGLTLLKNPRPRLEDLGVRNFQTATFGSTGSIVIPDKGQGYFGGPDDIIIAGYRQSPSRILEPVPGRRDDNGVDVVWPADSEILLFPLTQPRPSGEYTQSRIFATLLTPFAAIGDIAAVPVGAVFLLFNPCCN